MGSISEFWGGLGRNERAGLAAGMLLVLAAIVASAWWALRTDYEVLFSRLKPQDAAVMVGELDKLKMPYQLADDGTTILVDSATVHATRLKLMGREMPLHGAVGFELFNNADFGMTEFAQKINYQRALQGEITRTILSLGEVRDARVHLVLPEEGLFKRATHKAKAAITLTLNPGLSLAPQQISGIQKLVSASVPGVAAEDVTIVDQRGVAMTRAAPSGPDVAGASNRLDLKRETEELLTRKATDMLERAFGVGNAIASVDATLHLDLVKTTTEDVLGTPSQAGRGITGVMVRERESLRDAPAPLDARAATETRPGTSQREVEYQAGRRVEQVVSQPGAVRRLHVVAVVKRPLDASQEQQVKVLLGAAVGAVHERGDVVVVQSIAAYDSASVAQATDLAPPQVAKAALAVPGHAERLKARELAFSWPLLVALAAALATLAAAAAWFLSRRTPAAGPKELTGEERDAVAKKLQAWLGQPASSPREGG
jgi:flagellar M-ring protein FliF